MSVTAYTGGIFLEFLLGLPFWYRSYRPDCTDRSFHGIEWYEGVMTLSAIQTPILIIGSFLVLFLGLSALGGGSIATGWTEMMEHARNAMNVGADGHAYGANHMFHWSEADPMYQEYPGFGYSSELPSSVSGIGVQTSTLFNVCLDKVKEKRMMS